MKKAFCIIGIIVSVFCIFDFTIGACKEIHCYMELQKEAKLNFLEAKHDCTRMEINMMRQNPSGYIQYSERIGELQTDLDMCGIETDILVQNIDKDIKSVIHKWLFLMAILGVILTISIIGVKKINVKTQTI